MRFQLHLIRPNLGLYTDNSKQFVQTTWKNFKNIIFIKMGEWLDNESATFTIEKPSR